MNEGGARLSPGKLLSAVESLSLTELGTKFGGPWERLGYCSSAWLGVGEGAILWTTVALGTPDVLLEGLFPLIY